MSHDGETEQMLRAMTEVEYAAWLAESIPAYAAAKVESGQWVEESSLELSRKEHEALLPRGLATEDNFLYSIVNASSTPVGMLWFAVKSRGADRMAYVQDVNIIPQHQRQGHAYGAFLALEREVRRLGLVGVGLHVFGHNAGARSLYEKLGFRPTNIVMYKAADDV